MEYNSIHELNDSELALVSGGEGRLAPAILQGGLNGLCQYENEKMGPSNRFLRNLASNLGVE